MPRNACIVPELRLTQIESTSIGTRLPSVMKRASDQKILAEVTNVSKAASKTLQQLAILLKEHKTVNSIFVNAVNVSRTKSETRCA